MSAISSLFGNLPGVQAVVETFEAAITWGPAYNLKWIGAQIAAAAIDVGNTPTWRLRPGLVMGVISGTQLWTNYSATATDGSQVARGILAYGLRMQDVLTGSNVQKFYAMIIGGQVRGANLLGLDLNARNQMADYFMFDDSITGSFGNALPSPIREVTKVANYTVLTSDNGTLFDNNGAAAPVTFTLPAIATNPNFSVGFMARTAQNLLITSAEGANINAFNNAAASTLAFQTGGAIIGGYLWLSADPSGTFWVVDNRSAGANTVTIT